MEVVQGERRLTFVGGVHSVLYGDDGEVVAKAP